MPGRHHLAGGVDHPGALARVDEPDGGDAPVVDADVGRAAGQAGAVDDGAVGDHQVVGRHGAETRTRSSSATTTVRSSPTGARRRHRVHDGAVRAAPHGISRPHMPGYGILPHDEGTGLLPWTWATERLLHSHDYWLATIRRDGRPHVMPVWAVWRDDALWASSALGSRKARNLADDGRCTITTDDALEPVVVDGHAEIVQDAGPDRRLPRGDERQVRHELRAELPRPRRERHLPHHAPRSSSGSPRTTSPAPPPAGPSTEPERRPQPGQTMRLQLAVGVEAEAAAVAADAAHLEAAEGRLVVALRGVEADVAGAELLGHAQAPCWCRR